MQRLVRALSKVFAVMLTVSAVQALAAPLAGRDFDHTATGFPLNGGHATAACETCHVAGVFKGTAKTCDGCHALGKRVVATPKPTSHIVTDAPCETCHFNTSTFFGARYNHGTAVPGQCTSCHNGRISTGRPASHNAGMKATDSCDHCHRSYAFLPASWNHVGVAPHTCDNAGCHVQGSNQYYRSGATHSRTGMASYYCDECHNYGSWLNALFIHDRPSPSGACMGCHDGATAVGQGAGHVATTADCNQCHPSTVNWLGALGGMPAGHVANTAPACTSCHTGSAVATGAVLHVYLSTACNSCHYRGGTIPYTSLHPIQQSSHQGNTNCSSSSCHAPLGRQGTAYVRW